MVRRTLVYSLLLVAIVAVFGQTLRFDFVNYDDNAFVYDNPHIVGGLTPSSIYWAFTTAHYCMWAPVTWISHLLDYQVFQLRPWSHHLTNVLIHSASTLLLFWTLQRMTGGFWPSALAAFLFAIHPLHVETVAWVSERKGLLGGLFFIATLAAYTRYVKHPFSWPNYLLVVLCFVLGLMSKPVVVTLPFLMLLLDYWPFQRMKIAGEIETDSVSGENAKPQVVSAECLPSVSSPTSLSRLLLEKLPLFVLAIGASAAATMTQGIAVATLDQVPLIPRLVNACMSYGFYLIKFFYPANLSVFYPQSNDAPIGPAALALLVVAAISTAAVLWRRKCPYFFVGWFWYLGTLVPMLGLVQLGAHTMGDRHSYVTQIGLTIAIAWGLGALVAAKPAWRPIAAIGAIFVLMAFSVAAWKQTSYWRNSETLWYHALDCDSQNPFAFNNLGTTLARKGQLEPAIEAFRAAIKIRPSFSEPHRNLITTLETAGRRQEADAAREQAARALTSSEKQPRQQKKSLPQDVPTKRQL